MATTISKGDKDLYTQDIPEAAPRVRWLALGAVAGPLLFTLAWFILGFLSPGYTLFGNQIAPYSAISQPVSGLGLGSTAPYMNTAFVLGGILLAAGVIGIFKTLPVRERPLVGWICAALLLLSPIGMVIDGFFTLEAVLPHTIGFLLAAASPVMSFLVTGIYFRRIPGWQRIGRWLLLASPLTLVMVVLFFLTFDPMASGMGLGVAGIIQRILIIEVHAWFAASGLIAFQKSS